jgi:hypothetical protein
MSKWERDAEDAADTGFSDEDDTAPEGESPWELDPNDPAHPDFDLSEAAGYSAPEPAPATGTLWRPFLVLVSVLLILALILPPLIRFLYD